MAMLNNQGNPYFRQGQMLQMRLSPDLVTYTALVPWRNPRGEDITGRLTSFNHKKMGIHHHLWRIHMN